MFACKNCGGNIVYDIKLQKMVCNICHSTFEPEFIKKENDSVDYDFFETTEFTCPQCGARILCEDNQATGFCTYCCSSTILTSRVTKEKKPDYIIPFTVTKDECIEEYKKITKKAIFAPKALRDDKVLDNFKAIYMPYWYYNISLVNDNFSLSGMEKLSDTQSAIYNYYIINGSVDAELDGICKDASYKFSDDLSERIAPYITMEKKKFYPSYLSGFYADISDIPPEIYEHEMVELANEKTTEYVSKRLTKQEGDTIKVYLSNDSATDQFNTSVTPKRALFPVWFMSFKNKNKLAYMTVNGQTGTAASDLPISIFKYIIATFLMTLLLFIPSAAIMFLFYEHITAAFLDILLFMSIPAYLLYYFNVKTMQRLDTDSDDVGKFYNKYGVIYIKNDNSESIFKNFYNIYMNHDVVALLGYIVVAGIFILNILKVFATPEMMDTALKVLISVFNVLISFIGFYKTFGLNNTRKYFGIIFGIVSQLVVFTTMFLSVTKPSGPLPIIQIIDGILISIGCFMMFIDLVRYHNEIVLRLPPHLNKRGGDEIANLYNVNK